MPLHPRVSDLVSFDLPMRVAQMGSIGRAAAQLTPVGELVAGWAQPVLERAADLEAGIAALATATQSAGAE